MYHLLMHFSGVLGINQDASPYVAQFKALRTLSLTGDVIHFPISRGSKEDFRTMFTRCAQHVPSTLLHLSIWREGIWAIPLPVLSGLQELSMLDPTNLDRLGDIFGHCAQLRSLAIACIGADCGLEVLAALQAAPNALPYLTSFKLVLSREAYIPDADPSIEFFKNKEGMRRLDLQFNRLYPFGDVDEYSRFLDIFAQLPQLQVVGLDLTGPALRLEHLELLDERLPLGLSALLLKWSTYTSIASGIDTQDWIDMVCDGPLLTSCLADRPLVVRSLNGALRWATCTRSTPKMIYPWALCWTWANRFSWTARLHCGSLGMARRYAASSATLRPASRRTDRLGRMRRSM